MEIPSYFERNPCPINSLGFYFNLIPGSVNKLTYSLSQVMTRYRYDVF